MGDELRKICLCCDIVYLVTKNKETASLVQKVKMGNSRLILVEPVERLEVTKDTYMLQDVAMVLSTEERLILTCPPINRGGWPMMRTLDYYSKSRHRWLGAFDRTSQELHRQCNPGKGFYHGRPMKASGTFRGISLFMGARKLATQVSQALGASGIKLEHKKTRGLVYDRKDIKNNTLFGELYYGTTDFTTGIGSNLFTEGIVINMKFSEGEFFFVGQRPQALPKYQNIIFPFDTTIWILLIISVPVIVFGMSLVYRRALHRRDKSFKKSYVLDLFFMTLGVALMENDERVFQDASVSKRGFSLRALWLIYTYLLSMSYSGNLKASLTKKVYEKMPEDSYEMLEQELPVYVMDIGYDAKYYARHPNPWFNVMYQHTSQRNTFVSRKDFSGVLDRAFEGERLFLQSSTGLDNIQRMSFARKYGDGTEYPLIRIKKRYDRYTVVFVRQRYLQQTRDIEEVVNRFNENGIIVHDNKPAKIRDIQYSSGGDKFELEHILTPLFVLLATLAIAITAFVAEITCIKKKF